MAVLPGYSPNVLYVLKAVSIGRISMPYIFGWYGNVGSLFSRCAMVAMTVWYIPVNTYLNALLRYVSRRYPVLSVS